MFGPSDTWTSFESLDPEDEHTKDIENLLGGANFSLLRSKAVELRRRFDGLSGQITSSINTSKFTSGYYNVVLEIIFSDQARWIARIRLPDSEASDADIEKSMLSEIATMKLVKARTSLPVPAVYDVEVTLPNPVGYRYILMEALPGRILEKIFAFSVPREEWDKIARQLATYYRQLSTMTFDRMGQIWCGRRGDEEPSIITFTIEDTRQASTAGPFATSLEYFFAIRAGQTRAILSQHPGSDEWTAAAWLLDQALPSVVHAECIYGPFPLCHLDLQYNNILVDEEYNITGILDWSNAQTVPVERFMTSPEFITFPGLSVEENQPIVDFRNDFAKMVESCVDGEAEGQGRKLAGLVGSNIAELVYRAVCGTSWRALPYARLVLRQLLGPGAKFEDIIDMRREAVAL